MTNIPFSLELKSVLGGLAVSALSGLSLIAAGAEAEAGYTCVSNATQIGNNVVIEVVSTSGGSSEGCSGTQDADTELDIIPISGSITSAQVGATTDSVYVLATALTAGTTFSFDVDCTHSPSGGLCTSSNSGFISGVDEVQCLVDGVGFSGLPDPALPLVPVVITTTCTINY